jgi:hypothetical protein
MSTPDKYPPIYAFTGAGTEAPRPFILNLRGRQLGQEPHAQLGEIGVTP